MPHSSACSCSFANGMWRSFDELGSNWVLVPGQGSCRLRNLVNGRAWIKKGPLQGPNSTVPSASGDAINLTATAGVKPGNCIV